LHDAVAALRTAGVTVGGAQRSVGPICVAGITILVGIHIAIAAVVAGGFVIAIRGATVVIVGVAIVAFLAGIDVAIAAIRCRARDVGTQVADEAHAVLAPLVLAASGVLLAHRGLTVLTGRTLDDRALAERTGLADRALAIRRIVRGLATVGTARARERLGPSADLLLAATRNHRDDERGELKGMDRTHQKPPGG
jgi:hypothetical protein